MSFATIGNMASRTKNAFSENVHTGPPPKYQLDDEDTLAPRWYDVKRWGKKIWLGVAALIAIIITVVVVAVVEVEKKNRYPDYSKLTYSVADTYSGTDFFDSFDYYTGYDPSSGFVHYVDSTVAAQYNLTYASSTSAILRVDTSVTADSVPNASTGRFSVRISSKKQYGLDTLFIFDVVHTPIGCATWPALWTVDETNWPDGGEIDIMEAVNVVSSTTNQMTLHTTKDCTMADVKRKETGTALQGTCLNSTNSNAGCGVDGGSTSFGDGFNDNGGGVMALELRAAGIRVWQFDRDSIPSDITAGSPDPSTWSEATADFPNTDCSITDHFKNQTIIANIDLCGSWAGDSTVYAETCSGTCTDQVANNATAFTDAYWEFGSWTIYSAS
ncbi:putative glycosidase [Lachnellula suecica]|uniref:endo-1,3(4)-beta-glucanase n=1 Tax=Lachnellula suecica TaxID=602035 RepID=A0A8T9CIX0_9HELO|nr:putative glycosidase [Lachnellula suecica]